MQGFKNLFSFYINASFHVALAVVCLTDITIQEFDIPRNHKLLLFIFLATITGYNFVKYAGIAKLHHLSLAKNFRQIQILSFIAFAGLVYLIFDQSFLVLLFSGILGFFTLLYALPLFGNNTNLRSLTGLKIFVIAFVWAGVTVLLPLADQINLWKWDVVVVFLQRFFLVLALILPFEIRDLQFDIAQLGTIPQKFGVKGSKIYGTILIGFSILSEFLKQETSLPEILSLIIVGIITFIFLKKSRISQGEFYSSFWVEAIPIFWWIILNFLIYIFTDGLHIQLSG